MSPLKRVPGPSFPCLSGLVTALPLCLPLKLDSCPVPSLPEGAEAARLLHRSKEQRFPNNRLLVGTSEGTYSLLCSGRSAGLLSLPWWRQVKHRALGMGYQSSNTSMAPTLCLTWKLLVAPGKPQDPTNHLPLYHTRGLLLLFVVHFILLV